jgi:hypothetical protein
MPKRQPKMRSNAPSTAKKAITAIMISLTDIFSPSQTENAEGAQPYTLRLIIA